MSKIEKLEAELEKLNKEFNRKYKTTGVSILQFKDLTTRMEDIVIELIELRKKD